MKKKTSYVFGKKIYLLGKDACGTQYWLEAPSWDCDWYWGFGYVETYTNNKHPELSRDIRSHQHIDSSFMGNIGDDGERIYNIFDAPRLKGGTTFTEEEGWELSELFRQFYTLKESADFFHFGRAHVSKTIVKHDEETCHQMWDYINKTMIPAIFKRIEEILSPEKKIMLKRS